MPYSPPTPDVRHIPAGKCERCGEGPQDLRPYGPRNAVLICAKCGLRDWPNTKRRMRVLLERRLKRHGLRTT